MLSVIIPTLNEGRRIVALVKHLISLPGVGEVVIVDASDQDESLHALRQAQRSELVSVIRSNRRGRAVQMNLGAESCTCKTLLFLHSDTELPQNVSKLIDEQLS
ncbi:MAG: glycosyltransferase, partial [Arenicellales bacterium]